MIILKKLTESKKFIILVLLIVVAISVPTSVYGYNNYNFNKLFNSAIKQLNSEDFDGAITAFNASLKYKPNNKELVKNKVDLAKDLKDSKAYFDSAVALISEKKYLEAIDAFKVIKDTDVKRYNEAQNKIKECRDSYIKENLDNAKSEASNKNYDKAITYLNIILNFDNSNKDAQALKDEYNNIQQKAAEAKKEEDERIAAEKAKLTAQSTPKNTASIGDEVRFNDNLNISLNGGDPHLGRLMTLRYASVDPQPFGIVFQVVQGGFGYEINYDITFYLVGRTAKYSGKTSTQLVQIPAIGSEVPRGEKIKIVINFKVNGKTYTTSGYRVLNDRY